MNKEDDIQKSLAKLANDEKGWRKTRASAEGSFSRNLAEENLERLAVLRQTLLKQADAEKLHREHVMQIALADGIVTDHASDGVCEQLRKEGWLAPADATAARPHLNRAPAYLPTEKAVQDWPREVIQ